MFSFYVLLQYRTLYNFTLKRKEELERFRSKQTRKNVILREEFLPATKIQLVNEYEAVFGGDCGLRRKTEQQL
jgi:hypothetical protein